MKILYLCLDWGIPIKGFKGASVHVREFVSALHRQGHEVMIVTANRGDGNPDPPAILVELASSDDPRLRATEAARLGISDHEQDRSLGRELGKIAYDRALPKRALAALRALSFKPDLIYERYALFHRAGAEIAVGLHVPRILEVNAPLIEEQQRHRILLLDTIAAEIESECFATADHVLTVSDVVKSYVESTGIARHRVTCLPNGVDTQRFRPDIDPSTVRLRHGLGDRPVIGFVGSLKPWHGVESLFEVLRLIDRTKVDPLLMIVGDGPGFGAVQARAQMPECEGRVILVGRVPHNEIPAYLAAMTVTTAPYQLSQNFYFSPLKVLESLAAGRPVIVPNQGQLADLVDHGITGLLYPPGNNAAFARGLESLLLDTEGQAKMGEHARRVAEAKYSWDQVAARAMMIAGQTWQTA